MNTILVLLAFFGGAWVGYSNRKLIFLSGENISGLVSKALPMILGWFAISIVVGVAATLLGLQSQSIILNLALVSGMGCLLTNLLTSTHN